MPVNVLSGRGRGSSVAVPPEGRSSSVLRVGQELEALGDRLLRDREHPILGTKTLTQ